jgi:hypothetical protein
VAFPIGFWGQLAGLPTGRLWTRIRRTGNGRDAAAKKHNLHGSSWDYGSYAGTINQAAGATNNRTSTTW